MNSEFYKNALKLKVKQNKKIPAVSGWRNTNNLNKKIDTNKFNVGIVTGEQNNLIVLDVDLKDEGISEFKKYIDEYGEPKTLKASTPNKGHHYYFKYTSSNNDDQYLIKNCLLNKSKYRGKGLDIRSNGGYILAEPSKIDENNYKFINNFDVLEMPTSLIKFLLIDNIKPNFKNNNIIKSDVIKQHEYNNNIEFVINNDDLINMLNNLTNNYLNIFEDWLLITTCLKSCNKFEIWDNWSKQNLNKYNYNSNLEIWNTNKALININYLVALLNNTGFNYKLFESYKKYEPLTNKIKCKTKIINSRFVYDAAYNNNDCFSYDDFKNNKTIINMSDTSTGKTTAIIKHFKKYQDENNNKFKFLSIISKKSLGEQHQQNFLNENLILTSYETADANFNNYNNIVCCINSLLKYKDLDDDEISKLIIFIDEIALFICDLTHNDTLTKILKPVYILLKKLINKCHKVITCQASINDNVFNFLSRRNDESKIFIKNEYKNYNGITSYIYRDENNIYEKMKANILENNYFLCASDSKTEAEIYYNLMFKIATEEQQKRFILITAETKIKILNASEQFKDFFVFYSPSIIYGIDFNIDFKQDVFLLFKGNTLSPSESFQQITRTRQIKNVYIYTQTKEHKPIYNNIDEIKIFYKEINDANILINNMCVEIDEDDAAKINENSFFKLFVYNEYLKDIMQTNKTQHLINILGQRGFNIIYNDEKPKKISKLKTEEAKETILLNKEEHFNNYINSSDDEKDAEIFNNINDNRIKLNLPKNNEVLEENKDLLTDSFKLQEHYNIIRILKDDLFIYNKMTQFEQNNFKCNSFKSVYHKINILRQLEKTYNINNFDVSTMPIKEKVNFDLNLYKLIKSTVKTEKSIPKNIDDVKKLYVSLLKNITSSDFIKAEYTDKTKKNRAYNLNIDLIKLHVKTDKYINPTLKNYDDSKLNFFNIPYNRDVKNNTEIDLYDPFTD